MQDVHHREDIRRTYDFLFAVQLGHFLKLGWEEPFVDCIQRDCAPSTEVIYQAIQHADYNLTELFRLVVLGDIALVNNRVAEPDVTVWVQQFWRAAS